MSREEKSKDGQYYTVIAGEFRVQVPQDHPEAVRRDYELKDGTHGTKYERAVKALFGKITDVSFYEGDYGKNLLVTLDKNEETGDTPVISVGVATNYGEDFLKKLPSINFEEEVRIRPFAWTPEDSTKERRGIEITMRDEEGLFKKKVHDFFHDENKNVLHDYPTPEGDVEKYDTEDWKIYFIKARKFLIKYAEENIVPKFSSTVKPSFEYPTEEIRPEDIGF